MGNNDMRKRYEIFIIKMMKGMIGVNFNKLNRFLIIILNSVANPIKYNLPFSSHSEKVSKYNSELNSISFESGILFSSMIRDKEIH
jgi:hypothetical protein